MRPLLIRLLSALHRVLPFPPCRGDWLWTVGVAGAVFALCPILAAVVFSVVRKFTGNSYRPQTAVPFAIVGLGLGGLLPWLSFYTTSQLLAEDGEFSSMAARSCFVGDQQRYFVGSPTVFTALTDGHRGGAVLGIYLVALVGVPLLGLLFTAVLARAAFRRGPRWPGRVFLWLPFAVLVLGSLGLQANTVVSLWIGYVAMLLPGALVVALLGAPGWSAIDRRPSPTGPQSRPVPLPPQPSGLLPAAEAAPLANTPGPLPAFLAGGQPTPRPATMNPPMGTGERFRKIRTLGKGGFGTVFLAMDTHLGRTVAVKFAHVTDADTEQRMMREARALAATAHPNCVRIYDVVSEPEGFGIVMEYIEGSSLSDTVRGNGKLDDISAARLWVTMAGALDDAHRAGVLHRDVKPSNVIVDPNGAPHLIDFGIARSKGDMTLTQTGMMMGTPDFLAPETASGAGASPASDAWQLAATVSYAMCGQPPRGVRDTPIAALMAAARGERLTELPHDSEHAALLAAALHAEPARRPTLATLRDQLSRWLAVRGYDEHGPVSTVVTTPVDPERTTPARPVPRRAN